MQNSKITIVFTGLNKMFNLLQVTKQTIGSLTKLDDLFNMAIRTMVQAKQHLNKDFSINDKVVTRFHRRFQNKMLHARLNAFIKQQHSQLSGAFNLRDDLYSTRKSKKKKK